jgi:TolB protein
MPTLRLSTITWLCTLLTALFLAGCNQELAMRQLIQVGLQSQQAAAVNVQPGNRLLVQNVDGNIYTVLPDGTSRVPITVDASPTKQYLQPTWSPSAEAIAYSSIESVAGEIRSALHISPHNGQEGIHYEAPFAPFYIFWSPDGERLAYLSNWMSLNQTTIALRLVDFEATEEPIKTLVEGQPLYFSWSPDGQQMLTHIANEQIGLLNLDGTQEPLQTSFAPFPAPQWSADGSNLVYAINADDSQQLVLASADGSSSEEVTDFDERISFTLDPTGRQLAYVLSGLDAATAAFGPLYVVEIASGSTREISNDPVVSFFWSPDGQKLAYLAVEEVAGSLRLRWQVWDGEHSQPYAAIVPTRTFLQGYLAFFDQYAQSMTIWAPDSSAFVYAGLDDESRPGVWVQELAAEAEAFFVGPGVFAAWSPR